MRKVEVNIDIDTQPDRIIQAFTDPEMLKSWWDVERALIEKRPGGLYSVAWQISDKGFKYVSTGIIKEYLRDSVLEIENFAYFNPERPILGPMSLTVKAKKKSDTVSALYLCQDGYQNGEDWDWYYGAVQNAWPIVLSTLKEYLEKV
jgi:uncharacterized protein YndB with AHSA1/START domain